MKRIFFVLFFVLGTVFFSFAVDEATEDKTDNVEAVSDDLNNSSKVDINEEEKSENKTDVSFQLGSLQFYDRFRAKNFYSDYWGWYPQILMDLGVSVFLSGVRDMGLVFSGMTMGKNNEIDTSVKLTWGGGYEFFQYKLGPDGSHLNYYTDDDFWKMQEYYESTGQNYVTKDYDAAYAQWGLDWNFNFGFDKSPSSKVNFDFAYDGKFVDYLEDNRPESEQFLFSSDFPDRDRYLLHTFSAKVDYNYRTEVKQKFKHELYNIAGTSIGGTISPGFMNVSITGEHQKDLTDDGLIKRDNNGNLIYTDKLRSTADFYTIEWKAYFKRKIFDVNPNRKSVLFAGYINWEASITYADGLGAGGYIPLDFRLLRYDKDNLRHFQRNFAFNTRTDLIFMLPEIRVEDLKSWSPAKVSSDWATVEYAIGDFVEKLGITPNYKKWNDVRVIKPELRFNLMTKVEKELNNSVRARMQELWYDQQTWMNVDFWIDLNFKVFDMLNLGLVFKFQLDQSKFQEFWFRFG